MSDQRSGVEARRTWHAALLLTGCILAGLALGAAVPAAEAAHRLAIPALAVQTLVTVGALPGLRGSGAVRGGLQLAVVHLLVATAPVAAVATLVGLDDPIGFGIYMMAVAPPAALIPAYALVLRLDVRPLLVFCLVAYGASLVVTPLLVLVAAGRTVGVASIATTLGVGLIGPTLVARLLHRRIAALPERLRRAIVNLCVFVITLGLGGGIREGLSSGAVDAGSLVLVLAVLLGRTAGSGWLARLVSPRALKREAPLAGAFKNIALAAAVAGTLLGPAAALPALLAFPVEAGYFLLLSRRRANVAAQAP